MTDQPKSEACILVAEVTGDAPLLGKLGAMETQRAVERCRNRAERSIGAYEGFTLQAQGRTLIAHFPRSESAALAAFDLRERVRQLPPVSGVMLSVHAALHYGRLDSALQPVETALASAHELLAATPAGQIIVSQEAAAALPKNIRTHLEAAEIEGIPDAFVFRGNVLPQLNNQASELEETGIQPLLSESSDVAQMSVTAPAAPIRNSMMLRHNKSMLTVSDSRPIVLAGREEGNDLVIADRRASRHHARIEWRQGRYVLIDTSTNGTFMVDEGGSEIALRRAEADMPARGRISFGHSPTELGAEVVFFDIGQR